MNTSQKYDMHARICQKMNDLYRRKNDNYHDSFSNTFKKYGPISALVRINDKFERVESLLLGAENKLDDERLEDTLVDMANYCIMTIIELEGDKSTGGSISTWGQDHSRADSPDTRLSTNRSELSVFEGNIITSAAQTVSQTANGCISVEDIPRIGYDSVTARLSK